MTDNTPQEFPQTPKPKFNYLPSPPITPLCERSIKFESTAASLYFDHIGESTTLSDEIAKTTSGKKPRGRHPKSSVGRPSKSTLGSPRSTGKKLSVRRTLAATRKVPKRIGGAKPAIPSTAKSRGTTSKISKFKVEEELYDTKFEPSLPVVIKKPVSPKRANKPSVNGTKKVGKGRTTNNSLSTTLHPTIAKRKYQHRNLSNVGKICSSYYPSSHKVRPNPPGERYFKGTPCSPSLCWR